MATLDSEDLAAISNIIDARLAAYAVATSVQASDIDDKLLVVSNVVNNATYGNEAIKNQVAAVEVDTQNIQSRLPTSLVGGRVDASVGAAAANTLTASAIASDAVAEIQSGLATQASLDLVKAKTDLIGTAATGVTVLPGRDRGLPQGNKGRVIIAQGERITIARQVLDGNNVPVTLTGKTLQFVIETPQGIDLAVIASSDITISGSSYSFVVPEAASARIGNYTYALNDLGTSKALLASGDWIVEPRPLADS